jgi:Zn-dependent M16 (insulinase) family peptidase
MHRSQIPAPVHAVGDTLNGFRVDAVTSIDDIKALVYEATHLRTGALLIHVHCYDEENLFSVGFRTPPTDSSGVAHILEHSVLAGSDKYPVKDAFKELGKRTLNSFLNAMTWPDRTVYPTCSTVRVDLFNLASVYADLVFHPRLSRETFLQEGHHLTLEDLENPDSPLSISGVVYNEMKGVYSDPQQYVYREMQQRLLPDTTYGHDSGGDPDHIPSLTYEQFVAFHKRFYSPTNARFMLYGDIPLADHLAFLEPILAPFDRVDVDSSISRQPRWDAPRTHTMSYPVDPTDELTKKTFVCLTWLANDTADTFSALLLDIAMNALVGSAAGPLKKTLIDSGLGLDLFASGYSGDIQQASVSVGLRGTEPERAQEIEDLILSTIAQIVRDGIDPALIEATFHQIELAGKEMSSSFAISLMMRVNSAWYFGADPKEGLQFTSLVERARQEFREDPRVFEKVLQRWTLDNTHRLRLTVQPSHTLAAEREAEFAARMAALRAELGPEQVAQVLEQAQALHEAQETPDSPEAIDTLPKLSPNDIPTRLRTIPTHRHTLHGVPVLSHDVFTNGIAYTCLTFDTRDLSEEEAILLPMLGKITCQMGAAGMTYDAMSTRINRHTGGIGAGPSTGRDLHTRERREQLIFSTSALNVELPALSGILIDLLTAPDPTDLKRLSDLIKESATRMASRLAPSGHAFAYTRAAATLDPVLARREQWGGLTAVTQMRRLERDLADEVASISERLAALQKKLFVRSRLLISTASEPHILERLHPLLAQVIDALPPGEPVVPAPETQPFSTIDEGVIIPSQVNYVAQVLKVPDMLDAAAPALEMLAQIATDEFLYPKVRVQGGAYGGFIFYSGDVGIMPMVSYRDPNLTETLEVYSQLADFIRSEDFNEDLVDACRIGAIGTFERVLSPEQQLSTALGRHLIGITDEDRARYREGVIHITAQTIRDLALPIIDAALKSAPRTVFAPRQAILKANETHPQTPFTLVNPETLD